MPAVFHHLHRQVDRVSHVADCADPTGPQLCAFHHPRVELDLTLQVETRPDACVEQRLILELAHGGHRRKEGPSPDERPTYRERSIDRSLAQRALGDWRRPSAAVDDESWACHLVSC